MTDSLKFGPEWLRNMKPENANSNITTTVSAPIKMAEFRYGREEMLALFDRTVFAPDPLKQIQGLHVEKTQPPLALLQMTDEETRMWNRGINSDAVLRLTANKPGGPGPGPGAPGASMRVGVLGGRGGSVDRGRGRARGTYHYSRGLSYEDSDGFNGNNSYSRNVRTFDRTQSQGSTQWSERNGGGLGVDHGDWSGGNMSTSPRKEYSGRSMSDTNWRRHRGAGEEEEGWRSSKQEKWTRGSSWRDGDSNWETNRGSSGPTRTWDDNPADRNPRKPWESEDNALPEWATENPSESGGSFDASGAFHGGGVYSDDDEDVHPTKGPNRRDSGKGNHTSHKSVSTGSKEPSSNIVNGTSQTERIADRDKSNKSSSSGPGLRQSHSASSISNSNSTVPERKVSVPARSNTATNISVLNTKSKPEICEKVREEDKIPEPLVPKLSKKEQSPLKPKPQPELIQPIVTHTSNERSEEAMFEAANDLVAKLMEDEEKDLPKSTGSSVQQKVSQPPSTNPSNTSHPDSDKWYYRDPQNNIQGPFPSSEMAYWFKLGYFTLNLQLRRACDERYSPLGELIALFGHVPFLVNSSVPPIKANDNLSVLPTIPVTAAPPTPKTIDETLLLQQQYQYQQQMLLNQQALCKQLTQSERFNALTPLEQQQILLQQTNIDHLDMLSNYMPAPAMPQPAPMPTPPQSHANTQNSVIAMIQQLHQQQQAQAAAAGIVPETTHNPLAQQSIDPVQLIQQIGGLQTQQTLLPQPQVHQKQLEDQRCIEQLLTLFANVRKTSPHTTQPPPRPQTVKQIESVWGGATTTGTSYTPNWPLPPAPPGQLPASLWGELHSKGMKTEQDILEEQLRVEEERKKEERRKQEELKRLKEEMEEEERARQRREEEETLDRKRKEEEREKRRLEEEDRKKQEAAAKKAEQERLKKEEEKKRREEEKKRKEEQKRKQEEEKRKQEEDRKKQEEEKKRQEEENKRAEQAKRQAEALKRLQEQQQQQAQARSAVKASTVPAWTAPDNTPTSTSLTEIQKTERKQQQQLREQQQLLQLIQQQQQERTNNNRTGSSLNLKWAETKKPQARVKSLAEIQAEEQEQLAKQTEREKAERMAQAKEVPLPATSSIWANQNLTWNTQNSSSVWGSSTATGGSSSGPGFWEEVLPPAPAPKPVSKNKASNSGGTSSATKNRAKKEEMTVLKLFEQQPKIDDFFNWCTKTLSTMQSSVDIPTFVQFLREIEHPYEVQEYIRMYFGEGKEALDFASQFLERRSRAKTGEPQKRSENSTAAPVNHFQEVKGKNKKIKKGKMLRVDNRILGFSVTASQDRFNVGDRDYGENI